MTLPEYIDATSDYEEYIYGDFFHNVFTQGEIKELSILTCDMVESNWFKGVSHRMSAFEVFEINILYFKIRGVSLPVN